MRGLQSPRAPLTDGVVLLRVPREADLPAVLAHSRHSDLPATFWLPVPACCSRAAAHARLMEFQAGFQGPFGLTLILSRPVADAAFLGIIMVAPLSADTGEVCYGVAPAYRRQGLATHALTLLTQWVCRQRALRRLELRISVPNTSSQRVAEKAGFVREGLIRTRVPATGEEYDDLVYAYACTHGHAPGPALDTGGENG